MSRSATARSLLVLTALVASAAFAGQESRSNEISLYYKLVKDYRQGRAEAAIDGLIALPPSATQGLVRSEDLGLPAAEMNAAALLETEAGFRSGNLVILAARLSNADLLMRRGHRELRRLKIDPRSQDELRRRWSLTVGRKALWMTIVGMADAMLKDACETFPDDAALHLTYGIARETEAFTVDHLSIGNVARFGPNLSPSYQRSAALTQARQAFERAIALDPSSAEAHLRLGRVYVLQKNDEDAAPHFEQARTGTALPAYQYLASLMLGDVHARKGSIDAATELYLAARRLMPNAQSSYVAHAHALRSAGRAMEAAAVISEMLGRSVHDDDPWTFYPRGFELALTEFVPLRALVQEK
jgi:tetratricopeptide (TPR) repeat protein